MAEPPKPPKPAPPQGGFPFSPQDAMAFMQRMWNPFAMPMPATAGAAVPTSPGAGAPAASPDAAAAAAMPGMLPGMLPFPNPAAMFAALDPAEVERKIGELRIIEGWLQMSLNMMQMSIKTLELQKASLEAMRGSQAGAASADPKSRKS